MSIVEIARSVAGDSLRSVAEYRETEYEIYYIRADVDQKDLDLDEMLTVHFAFPNGRGLFVSVDADGAVPPRDLVERYKGWYDAGRTGSAYP